MSEPIKATPSNIMELLRQNGAPKRPGQPVQQDGMLLEMTQQEFDQLSPEAQKEFQMNGGIITEPDTEFPLATKPANAGPN